jgi:hypothetical protein
MIFRFSNGLLYFYYFQFLPIFQLTICVKMFSFPKIALAPSQGKKYPRYGDSACLPGISPGVFSHGAKLNTFSLIVN